MAVSFWAIAADLRRSILEGREGYRPGDTLPTLEELARRHGAAYQTVRSAVGQLRHWGLVETKRHVGTVVRQRPDRRRIGRSRQVYRDEIGYYFDPIAQPWAAIQPPTIKWDPAPFDIAPLLDVEIGDEVLIRDRLMGTPDDGQVQQLATSYLPAWLARGTVLEERDTGPGGIYDRMEEWGYGPLRWSESVSARTPFPEESDALGLPPGVPLLRLIRTTTSATGDRVLEINDTRMNAEAYEIGYSIRRSPSARPAAGRDPQGGQDR